MAAVAALGGMATMTGTAPSVAADPCAAPPNEIVAENCLPGTSPSIWDVPGSGSSSIQGFATNISVNQSQRVDFKIDTTEPTYRMDIYRMGYYGGDGARKVAAFPHTAGTNQPTCPTTEPSSALVECSNWSVSASWNVPATAVSGIYFAHLVGSQGGESHIFFVVRDDDGRSDLLFQTSDTTWQAYNTYGGPSLYTGGPGAQGGAYKVSYDRPLTVRGHAPEDSVFNAEYPMVRWLERNGYDVSYFTGVDSDRLGAELREHRALLSVGHDEYWSSGQRANWEAARAAGVHMAFLSGNEVFWKTRWEKNHRTLVAYKETHAGRRIDPTGIWTGTWRDPRFGPHDGGRPENALTGQLFTVNDGATDSIEVPAADGKLRFWRHTNVGDVGAVLPFGTLGYEWDEDIDNGHRPPGSFRVSSTTRQNAPVLTDWGSNFGSGTAVHNMTLYRAPSGARVFGAGTVQWSWGLDSNHERGNEPEDLRMQQATANVFADMGAHAATPQSNLVRPSCSSDTAAPTSRIVSVSGNTISGTAADTGGGRVGGVEVSPNGGATWHPAVGRENWSYTSPSGVSNARSRAVDDSGNLEGRSPAPALCDGPLGGGSAGGGGGGAAGSGAVKAKPRAVITRRRARVSRAGMVTLRIACSGGRTACKVRLQLRRKGRTIAKRRVVISQGGPRKVRLFIGRSVRRKLARKGALRVTVVASVRDAAGHRTVTRKPIRLLASRGR